MNDYSLTAKKHLSKDQDRNFDKVLQILKDKGATQMECAYALIKGAGLSLGEADNIVVNSPVWIENKELNDDIRKSWNKSDELDT